MSPGARGSPEGQGLSTVGARARPSGDRRPASGAAPPRVLLAQPAREARLVEAQGVPTDRRKVRHGAQGPTDPVARILRAFDAERDPAIAGTLLDRTVAPEAERRRGAATRADEAVGRGAQGPGEGFEARDILRGPRAVHGTRAAIRAADPREARIDLAVVEDRVECHEDVNPLEGVWYLPKDSRYLGRGMPSDPAALVALVAVGSVLAAFGLHCRKSRRKAPRNGR